MRCVGAILYFENEKPVAYELAIEGIAEPQPDPSRAKEWKRATFKEAYEQFGELAHLWHPNGRAKAWDRQPFFQIHLSTVLFLAVAISVLTGIQSCLWENLPKQLQAKGVRLVLVLLQIAQVAVVAYLIEVRIRRQAALAR